MKCPYCHHNIYYSIQCADSEHEFYYDSINAWYLIIAGYKFNMIGAINGRFYLGSNLYLNKDVTINKFNINDAVKTMIKLNKLNCFI